MKINENLISLSPSSIPIDGEINMGDDVVIKVSGSVVKIEDSDNQDGTINRVYKIKGIIGEILLNDKIINKKEIEEW